MTLTKPGKRGGHQWRRVPLPEGTTEIPVTLDDADCLIIPQPLLDKGFEMDGIRFTVEYRGKDITSRIKASHLPALRDAIKVAKGWKTNAQRRATYGTRKNGEENVDT